jgi:hypothetical protein
MTLDRTIRKRWPIALCAALALAACSRADAPVAAVKAQPPATRPLETVHAEFSAFETSGTDLADVLAAIHASEPGLYDKLVEIAASPSWTGTPADAMKIGRPLYLSAFRGKLPIASDKDVNELIDILIETHKALLTSAPLLCAQGEKAELADVGKFVPADVLVRENRLQSRVIRVTDQSTGRATQAEIEDWKAKTFKGDEPRLKGNVYFELTDPTPEQATAICDSEMFILEKMRAEKPDRRAYLYRGLMSPR